MTLHEVYTMYWEVGAHTSFSKKILPTIEEAIKYGMYSCQFFMGNPRSYNRQRISHEDINDVKKALVRFPLNVFTHFPYIANLNGSVKSLAWSGDDDIDMKLSDVLKELEYELSIISNFSTDKIKTGVVIHPGSYQDRDVGLDTIARSINMINFTGDTKLLLENCAGEGRKLCKDFAEISRVIRGVEKDKKKNIGVCVDTAHIWGVGDYDLRKCSEIDRMFSEFEENIGIEYFSLLHLNDSKVEFGSKKDRHACLGTGYIWSNDFESLIYLLNKCRDNEIPIILETNGLDMITLSRIQPSLK
jgi:deoxyribonuclease-4